MHIMFMSPEVWPFTRVGGLAEVAHDLPLALGERGGRVEVVTPKCRMPAEWDDRLEVVDISLEAEVSWRRHRALVSRLELSPRVTVYFISHEHLFDREGLYGNAYGDYQDNAERFIFYCRASLELARAMGWTLDVVHANDWTTGLAPLYMKPLYAREPSLAAAGCLLTVLNLANQGVFWHYDMPLTGLGWEYFTAEGLEFNGKINFLKAGLMQADVVSTVSRRYAQEILQPETGCGLDGILRGRADGLSAIVNGMDYDTWNPETDPLLAANFGPGRMEPKALCARDIRREMGLDDGEGRPLAVVIGRLLDRRGLDILAPALERILEMGLDLAVMGHGEGQYHAVLEAMSRQWPGRMAVRIGYWDDLAHKLLAGADMLLMPSRFEPCGLHQMHAMRYGAAPVVRATGGLDDTVSDHAPERPGDGFKFEPYESRALLKTLRRALDAYARPREWSGIVQRAMARDFSWQSAAPRYEELYRRAMNRRRSQEGD